MAGVRLQRLDSGCAHDGRGCLIGQSSAATAAAARSRPTTPDVAQPRPALMSTRQATAAPRCTDADVWLQWLCARRPHLGDGLVGVETRGQPTNPCPTVPARSDTLLHTFVARSHFLLAHQAAAAPGRLRVDVWLQWLGTGCPHDGSGVLVSQSWLAATALQGPPPCCTLLYDGLPSCPHVKQRQRQGVREPG